MATFRLWGSETLEWILMKLGIYWSRGCDLTCKFMWHCDNVGGLGVHITRHMYWFLSRLFSWFFILGIVLRLQPWTRDVKLQLANFRYVLCLLFVLLYFCCGKSAGQNLLVNRPCCHSEHFAPLYYIVFVLCLWLWMLWILAFLLPR